MNVDRSVDYERIDPRCIDVVFVETDQIILDLDILLVETEGRTDCRDIYRRAVHPHIPVDGRGRGGSGYRQFPLQGSRQFGHLVRNERVYHLQWQGGDVHISVQIIRFSHFVIGIDRRNLVTVAEKVHVDLMLLVAKWQVNSVEHQFTYPSPFIEQAVDMSVRHNHEAAVRRGILQVGAKHSSHGREVRESLRDRI